MESAVNWVAGATATVRRALTSTLAALLLGLVLGVSPRLAPADECLNYANHIRALGGVPTPGLARGIAVSGSSAFLAGGTEGLVVLSVANPDRPEVMRLVDTPAEALGVAVTGGYAYVADGAGGLQVVDITTPELAAIVGFVDTPGEATDVALYGGVALVADGAGGVQAVDVITPAAPSIIGALAFPTPVIAIEIAGDCAYVLEQGDWFNDASLHVLDISVPGTPVEVGSVFFQEQPEGLAVADGHAYVASWDNSSGWLQIFDVTTPQVTSLLGAVRTPDDAYDVAVAGDIAFVATFDWSGQYSSGLGAIQVIDVSDRSAPELMGSVDPPSSGAHGSSGGALGVVVEGRYLYVASGYEGLRIVDVARPTPVPMLGSVGTQGWALDVAVKGNHAFVAARWDDLQVIDVSDPTSPTIVDEVNLDSCGSVEIAGDYAFAYSFTSPQMVHVIDISYPPSSLEVEWLSLGTLEDVSGGLAVQGTLACVTDWRYVGSFLVRGRLQVIDVSDPQSIHVEGTVTFPGSAGSVAMRGQYAYVANGDLRVIDLGNPASPAVVDSVDSAGAIGAVTIADDRLYVVEHDTDASEYRLLVLGLTNPASPTVLGAIPIPRLNVAGLTASDDYVYVTDGAGFIVVSVADPAAPVIAGGADTPGHSVSALAQGGRLYVTHGDWRPGLSIWPLQCDAMTPVAVSGFSALATELGIRLSWRTPTAVVDAFSLIRDLAREDGRCSPSQVWYAVEPSDPTRCDWEYLDRDVDPGASYVYRLMAMADDGSDRQCGSLEATAQGTIATLRLSAWPSPSRGAVSLSYEVPRAGNVRLDVFDLRGRRIRTLASGMHPAGRRAASWDGRDTHGRRVGSGVYTVILQSEPRSAERPL